MTSSQGLRASLASIWKSHPRTVGGLLLLLTGNALLPLFAHLHRGVWFLDYVNVLVLAFWAAGLCWQRARRAGPVAFGLLGLGAALGGLRYVPTMFSLPQARFLGPAFAILGLLALGTGFLRWPQRVRMPGDRVRTSLDGIAITLSMFTVAWVVLGSADWVGRLPRGLMLIYLLQISVILGLMALWLLQETRLRLPEQAPAKRYVRWALLALLCHGAVGAMLRVTGLYFSSYLGNGIEVLHQLANVLLALAALDTSSDASSEPAQPDASPVPALLPSALSLVVLLLAAFQLVQPQTEPPHTLMGLVLGLLAVLGVRHGLLILDLEQLSRNLEDRVQARTRQLEAQHQEALSGQRVRMMAGLAAGLAHDLNNILGIIRLMVGRLEETCPAGHEEDLKVLGEASGRACALTRRIIDSSRHPELEPTVFPFAAWMRSQEGLLRALLHPGQRLTCEVGPELLVFADAQSLDQVFQNLVANARDAMGPTGRLSIRAAAGIGTVQVEVRDDGSGIAPEHQARLFEPFFTTKLSGTGLGLATVGSLVLQNRGRIRVESEVGRGTAFHIELPAPEGLSH